MSVRIDVSAFDDTGLGAEVRHMHAEGHRMVTLIDSSEPDERAGTWVDGTHGLYKLQCARNHVWLSVLTGPARMRRALQGECPSCGLSGYYVDAG